MSRIIESPPPELKAKYGPLAHVTEEERQRIWNLPYGCFWPEVRRLEKEIAELRKQKKKLQKESDYRTAKRFQPSMDG